MAFRFDLRPEPIQLRIPLSKQADLGGPGNDQSFEQAFSNLASSYIADKAPSLLEYEIGFQLVDRDESNNKAVGIFGFKAGPTWLYAPIFFVGGDLKGHELLYIKNKDQFVPLEEGWINDLLSKVPPQLGGGVNRSNSQSGVRYPDLQRSLAGPHKYAAFLSGAERAELAREATSVMERAGESGKAIAMMPDWAKVAVAKLAKVAVSMPEWGEPRLLDLVADGGIKVAEALHKTLKDYPLIRAGFDQFYDESAVKAAGDKSREIVERPPVARTRPTPLNYFQAQDAAVRSKVAVYRFDPSWSDAGSLVLDAEDRAALVAAPDGLLIKDARADDEVSKAYVVDDGLFPRAFTNPDETGIYDVLMKEGEMERCLVVMSPTGACRALPWCTVVRLDSGRKAFLNVHHSYVWVGRTGGRLAGDNWFEEVQGHEGEAASDGSYYLAVGEQGTGTVPFRVVKELSSDPGGKRTYDVLFDTHADRGRSIGSVSAGYRAEGIDLESMAGSYNPQRDGQRVHLGHRSGSKLRAHKGDLYIPEGFKLVRLSPDAEDPKGEDVKKVDGGGMKGQSAGEHPILLGDAMDVDTGILRKMAKLTIRVDGHTTVIDDRAMATKDAVVHLVRGLGLRPDDAYELLAQGAQSWTRQRKAAAFWLKKSDPYRGDPYLTAGGPQAPFAMDPPDAPDDTFSASVPGYGPSEQRTPVSDLASNQGDREGYRVDNQPDQAAAQLASEASQTGQRELFDTSMVNSLLKSTSDDALVDRYMPDQMKALNNWGIMLFNFFWHGERFAERYGEGEMPEIEDSLRNTFETTGKTILYLRRKTINASPDEAAQMIDLDGAADK